MARAKTHTPVIRIGMSGWTYPPWRGTFYPKGLAQKNELAYASAMLPSIEVNGTFYTLLKPKSFAAWHEQTPDGFVFSIKAPKFITHVKRLRDVKSPVANFLSSGVLRLNEKLGPILWQLPPSLVYDEAVVTAFLESLPHRTAEVSKLSTRLDPMMKGRTWTEIDHDRPLRHAVEVRHASFENAEFVELLRQHNVALVIADTGGKWPAMEDVTADFIYARLHGPEELYSSGYTEAGLTAWAKKFEAWSGGGEPPKAHRVGPAAKKLSARDVYVYFDNDLKVRSPFDAARLAVKLGMRNEPMEEGPAVKNVKEVPRTEWPPLK